MRRAPRNLAFIVRPSFRGFCVRKETGLRVIVRLGAFQMSFLWSISVRFVMRVRAHLPSRPISRNLAPVAFCSSEEVLGAAGREGGGGGGLQWVASVPSQFIWDLDSYRTREAGKVLWRPILSQNFY